jgi:Holliday junction resolvase RusA-like endonuclease
MGEWQWVPIKVVAKGRPRLGRRRKAFTPPKTIEFEDQVRAFWSETKERYPADAVLSVEVLIDRDGFWVLIEELEASHRPVGVTGDVDNYVKSILDGTQDKQVGDWYQFGAFPNDKMVEQFSVAFVGTPRKKKVVPVCESSQPSW